MIMPHIFYYCANCRANKSVSISLFLSIMYKHKHTNTHWASEHHGSRLLLLWIRGAFLCLVQKKTLFRPSVPLVLVWFLVWFWILQCAGLAGGATSTSRGQHSLFTARVVVHASTTLSTICAKVCVLLANRTILSLGSQINTTLSDFQGNHLKGDEFNLRWLNFSSSVI